MPRKPQSKYFWPASGISESDMSLLYRAREASPEHIPISRLIAHAVRETYGKLAPLEVLSTDGDERREAA